MMSRIDPALLALLGSVAAFTAHAEIYLSPEQAAQAIFPTGQFSKVTIVLNAEQKKTIEKNSGQSVRNKSLVAWKDAKLGTIYFDQVLGKHEFISIAVGIEPSGKTKAIEILEYRETYGQQVRDAKWRDQFVGADVHSKLELNSDIKNISGATLSSLHVTNGVRRLVVTHSVLQQHP